LFCYGRVVKKLYGGFYSLATTKHLKCSQRKPPRGEGMSGKRIKKALAKFGTLFPQAEPLDLPGIDAHLLERVVYHTSQIPPPPLYVSPTDEPTFTLPDLSLGTNEQPGGLAEAPDDSNLRRLWTSYELLMFYRNAGGKNPREYAPRIQEHILQNGEADDRPLHNIVILLSALKRCWAAEGIGTLETAINANNLARAEDAFDRLYRSDMPEVRNYALDKMAAYRKSQRDEPEARAIPTYPARKK